MIYAEELTQTDESIAESESRNSLGLFPGFCFKITSTLKVKRANESFDLRHNHQPSPQQLPSNVMADDDHNCFSSDLYTHKQKNNLGEHKWAEIQSGYLQRFYNLNNRHTLSCTKHFLLCKNLHTDRALRTISPRSLA